MSGNDKFFCCFQVMKSLIQLELKGFEIMFDARSDCTDF